MWDQINKKKIVWNLFFNVTIKKNKQFPEEQYTRRDHSYFMKH